MRSARLLQISAVLCMCMVGMFPAHASDLYPDEPAGWNQLVRHQFSDKTNGGTCVDYYPSQTYAMILGSPSMGISPPNFLREIKPAGSDIGGTQLECFFPARSGVFWGFNLRTSNPFGGYNNGMNKIGFVMSTGPGSGAAWGLHYYGASNGSRVIAFFLQSGPEAGDNCQVSNTVGDCAGGVMEFLPNINSAPVVEGVEHRVEVTMIRSTPGLKNGVLRLVVDGSLRTYQTNVSFPPYDFISVQTNHTWDGQCSQRNPAVGPTTPPNDCRTYDDFYDWGDWYVSSGTGVTPPPPSPTPPSPTPTPPPGIPGNVNDLSAIALNATSVQLSFTAVDDGTGSPAKYDIRQSPSPINWGAAPSVTQGTCSTPYAPNVTGPVVCKITGLTPGTAYQFQLVPYRGTLNAGATFAASLSNVASISTPFLPAPMVTSFSPLSGSVGTSVVIAGTAFDAITANNTVKINGQAVTVTAASETSITITIPGGATTGRFSVQTSTGTGFSDQNFVVTVPDPVVIPNSCGCS